MNFPLGPCLLLLSWGWVILAAVLAAAAAAAAVRRGFLAALKKTILQPDPNALKLSKLYLVAYPTAEELVKLGILNEPGYEDWTPAYALWWKDRCNGIISARPVLPQPARRPNRETSAIHRLSETCHKNPYYR